MKSHSDLPPPHNFHKWVSASKVGESGLIERFTANEKERLGLAAFLQIVSVEKLEGEVRLSRWRAKGILAEGTLHCELTQSCVITLEPVPAVIDVDFERRFLPLERFQMDDVKGEIVVDPEGEDPPEVLTNEIDFGSIVAEEVSLALNPYPRKEGVAFEAADSSGNESPFAVLAKLKRP